MSSPTGTTINRTANSTGITISGNPLRRSIMIQNAEATNTVYVFLGAFADIAVAKSMVLIAGASISLDGYIGDVHLICAPAQTADVRVAEIDL
jgi:hypothetical protein